MSAAGEKSCPLRGDDRTAFGECLKYRIGIAGLCDAATAEMTGCSLKVAPVGSNSRLVIGIPAPCHRIRRGNGIPGQVAGDHGKAGRPAAGRCDGAAAIRNVPVIGLEIVRNLHSVCRIASAGIGNLIIPENMLHIFLVPIPVIMPVRTGTHHIRISNGVFFGITAVTFHCPVDIAGAVIVTLKRQLDAVQVGRSGTSCFIQCIL